MKAILIAALAELVLFACVFEEFVSRQLVAERLATMATNGFVIERGSDYVLSPKGRLTATVFSWIKRLWRLGAGG
jgi:hypothetical protein